MRATWLGGTSLLLVLLTGCDTPALVAYPLTSRVLQVLDKGRPYQLRLSATQRYRACGEQAMAQLSALVCPPSPSMDAVSNKLANLAPSVLAALRERPDADAMWAAALLDVWSGRQDARLLDRAIARLTEVRSRDTSMAAVLNHLAVAHAARASLRDDPRDLYSAVDLIERAGALDGSASDIAFNRALLLSSIRMTRQASGAWAEALRKDSRWREEVAAAFAQDSSEDGPAVVDDSANAFDPQAARQFVLDTLLTNWAEARLAASISTADSIARQVDSIAVRIVQVSGDSSVTHIARDLSRPDQQAVANGTRSYADGMRSYARPAFAAAGESFRQASGLLRRAGAAALADWSDNQVAAVHMSAGELTRASDGFTHVVNGARLRGDRALEARALWGRGIASARGQSMAAAEGDLVAAESVFVSIGERRNGSNIRITLGEVYGFLGRGDEAARSFNQGFASKDSLSYEDLMSLGQWMSEAQPWAFAVVMRELVFMAEFSKREKDLPESLLRLAQAEAAIGQPVAAAATLAKARAASKPVTDSLMRSRLDAELDRSEADLKGAVDPREAVEHIDAARGYFSALPLEDAGLLLRRSRLMLAIGDSARAGRDLNGALDIVQSLGVAKGGVTDRPVAATTREAQRALIALDLARGDTGRAYSHVVALGASTSTPSRERVRSPELRFVVLPDRVLTWLYTNDAVRVTSSTISRSELLSLVERFSNLLRSGDDTIATDSLSRRLYALLLSPHEAALENETHISVAGDDALNDVPLAFLTGRRGRLVEHLAVRYMAPGLTSPPSSTANTLGRGPLLVVNPEWSRSTFPGLEPLRWAESETRSIAQLRTGATVLSGIEATRSAVMTALSRNAIIHFAGHARVVTENPASSHLVLAPSGALFSDGVLFASDIARLRLPNVRLVVLSACGRSSTSSSAIGQVNGLATAFLDAGAATVLSGLWEIDDEVTARLMTSVHEGLARGLRAEDALRQAQVSLLRESGADGKTLSVAAAFVVHTRKSE